MISCHNIFRVFLLAFLVSCAHLPYGMALSADEYMRLGSIYESKGEPELALREYRNAIEADGERADAHFAAANVCLSLNRYEEAGEGYRKASEIDPKNGAYLNNLGWVYMETGRMKEAEKAVMEALRADPEKAFIYFDTLGVIQTKAGKLTEAEDSLVKALSIAPLEEKTGVTEIYRHLSELYIKTGNAEGEKFIAERLKKLTE